MSSSEERQITHEILQADRLGFSINLPPNDEKFPLEDLEASVHFVENEDVVLGRIYWDEDRYEFVFYSEAEYLTFSDLIQIADFVDATNKLPEKLAEMQDSDE